MGEMGRMGRPIFLIPLILLIPPVFLICLIRPIERMTRMTFHRTRTLVLAAVIISGAPLSAHDMWIEPATFFPESGQIVAVGLRVGQDLLGDPIRRSAALIDQFVVEDASGRKPVVGRDGGDPAGVIRAATTGMLVIGYRSNPSAVELEPAKFNQYLKEEGLEAIAALRARRNESGARAREIFTRCAKSLVLTGGLGNLGGPGNLGNDRPLGFTLELVAERNPSTLRAGQDLPVRLTFENRPLADALVVAINRLNPSEKLAARTDNDGRVRFQLKHRGMWLVKAVHMVPAPAGAKADWASYWASLTFELKAQI
jgi:hypothetical protein